MGGSQRFSLVVPTWNEVGNVYALYQKVRATLDGYEWELIFVDDDSADRTWEHVEHLALEDSRVRLIRRIGRTGLASACVEGMAASTMPLVAVMDADLQHDETLLARMLDIFNDDLNVELVVASRKIVDASFGDMPGRRVWISEFATRLTKTAVRTELSDPMSGFFMLRRDLFNEVSSKLYGQGFKILLDICAAAGRKIELRELPYRMRARQAGESKLGIRVIFEFAVFLVSQWLGRVLPQKFIMFCLVGASGILVHMGVLAVLYRVCSFPFNASLIGATGVAMVSNFILNNRFTFAEFKLHGLSFWCGLLSFILICTVGAIIGISVGETMYKVGSLWWVAGMATTCVAAVWNFSVSSALTWNSKVSAKSSGKTSG